MPTLLDLWVGQKRPRTSEQDTKAITTSSTNITTAKQQEQTGTVKDTTNKNNEIIVIASDSPQRIKVSGTSPKRNKLSDIDSSSSSSLSSNSVFTKSISLDSMSSSTKSSITTNGIGTELDENEFQLLLSQNGLSDIDKSWYPVLTHALRTSSFRKVTEFVSAARKKATVFPPPDRVFAAILLTPLSFVKVVILGQDPYHGPGQAHGLSFSVPKGIAIPPSLRNILKEIKDDIGGRDRTTHGGLENWARQGVLLLNTVLTVESGKPLSHASQGWEDFTKLLLKAVGESTHAPTVFMLWGKTAQALANVIDKKRHLILEAPHPSPLSCHKGFSGCKHFSQANTFLEKAGRGSIDWTS